MISVRRLQTRFYPDPKRVIARFFMPGVERAKYIIEEIINLPDEQIRSGLYHVFEDYAERHRKISIIFKNHYDQLKTILKEELNFDPGELSDERKMLIGSYFTMEYSIESTAFFNPSIVEDPDQEYLEDGQKRVIVSFRATGEGHISSLVFRSGILTKDNELMFKPFSRLVELPENIKRHVYNKEHFIERIWLILIERRDDHGHSGIHEEVINAIMGELKENFVYGELLSSIEKYIKDRKLSYQQKRAMDAIERVANSHYEMEFSTDTVLSERVIFPFSFTEAKGIEDMRFVRFMDDDGTIMFYSTYSAYSNAGILTKFISTEDFRHFKVKPVRGEYAENKGLAFFPRRIKNKYAMLSRVDGVNNYVMFSDYINVWNTYPQKVNMPEYPWEFVQVGNCGSPLETDKGWLAITHGVGPMRRYSLGAILLDLDDPTRLIAKLEEPLMIPNEEEREGYVPNVVYSCGAIINNGELVIPYSMSDYASSFVAVGLDELFSKMQKR